MSVAAGLQSLLRLWLRHSSAQNFDDSTWRPEAAQQEKLLQALTRGLEGVAHVDPWTTSFNPGTTTLERLFLDVTKND